MAQQRKQIEASDVQGLQFFRTLSPLLTTLHEDATQRDKAQNRKLFFDQYTSLLLLYFFSPALTSLRAIQQASELKKVQKRLGCSRASLGSLSEASTVFDPDLLREILGELAQQALPVAHGKEAEALAQLTAVDGSLLPALPKMAWALWQDEDHRAAKLHLCFEVYRGVPVDATLTEGNGSERSELRKMLQPGRLYVMDRGYSSYEFFQDIVDRQAAFICRVQNSAAYRVVETKTISPAATVAGVIEDVIVDKLGSAHKKNFLRQPMRVVKVDTGELNDKGQPIILVLATSELELDSELIALAYKFRWAVELFFRWFKCILGCRHLLAHSENGVTIQMYAALIASLLISLWAGRKPTKRTYEMICHYFNGWADEQELLTHIQKLKPHSS